MAADRGAANTMLPITAITTPTALIIDIGLRASFMLLVYLH